MAQEQDADRSAAPGPERPGGPGAEPAAFDGAVDGAASSARDDGSRPPAGEVYDWYRRGMDLLGSGDAGAAAQVLEHAQAVAPESASLLEAYARALFDAGRHAAAVEAFERLVDQEPGSDYAQFGLGLALTRVDRFTEAVDHLALASVMRPRREYTQALAQARATLRYREHPDTG